MTATPNIRRMQFDFSNPDLFNRAYVHLFDNKSRFIHLFGSAGSGKSVFGCQKEVVQSFDSKRSNRKTLVVRKFYNTLVNSVYAQIKSIIYGWGYEQYFEITRSPLSITNNITNVQFIFAGLDDVEKIKSIQGVDRILIEEATELSNRNELEQLSLRLRGFSEVQITLMYNPINVFHWLSTDFHQTIPADHSILKTTYKDNRFLDVEYIKTLENLQLTNPNFYRVYALGEWGQNSEGLIYPDYETVAVMPEAQFYGLDFGHNHPTAMTVGAVADNFESAKEDYFIEELIYESHLTATMLIDRMNMLGVSKQKLIIADNARPEMIAAIKTAGFNIKPCKKYAGSVLDGIATVKKYNLKILAGSKNLFKEITNYSWREKNGQFVDSEPMDAMGDILDAARYALQAASRTLWTQEIFRLR
ncbi:MAG TPA: PBSX family phage terminase large subunit [Pyrinomonadaceae bacterium]|nr:PBSX family phage terminase large subunit [Pyrinomonadaceae bacterium]